MGKPSVCFFPLSLFPSHNVSFKLPNRAEEESEEAEEELSRVLASRILPRGSRRPTGQRAPIKINAFAAFLVTVQQRPGRSLPRHLTRCSAPEQRKTISDRPTDRPPPRALVLFLVRYPATSHPLLHVYKAHVVAPRESFSLALFSLDHSSARCSP